MFTFVSVDGGCRVSGGEGPAGSGVQEAGAASRRGVATGILGQLRWGMAVTWEKGQWGGEEDRGPC